MSETWYAASGFDWSEPVQAVQVESYTAGFVVLQGEKRRTKRVTEGYHCYFQTWKEARDHQLRKAEAGVQAARLLLQKAEGRLGNIKGLRPPETVTGES